MSWNIQKKQTNAAFIAKVMQVYGIDICALLEVPNSSAATIGNQIVAHLNNLNPAYFMNEWSHHAVDVGDEAVAYIWHQTAAQGANAFQVELYANAPANPPGPARKLAGKVTRNAANAPIYFPTTQFSWGSLPGRPNGRRPAFMSFLTNDGAAPRRFTVLDIHTPFNVDTAIQAYSDWLYATSREVMSVETQDAGVAAQNASVGLAGHAALTGTVDPLLNAIPNTNNFIDANAVRTAAVNSALAAIEDAIAAVGSNLPRLFANAYFDGIENAVAALDQIPLTITVADAGRLARACAMAGCVSAAALVASIRPPNAPPAATASAVAAALAAAQAVTNEATGYVQHPNKRNPAQFRAAVRREAQRLGDAAVAPFIFGALPLVPVNASIMAGDFNIPFPDVIQYTAQQQAAMNGATDAYANLAAVAASPARNTQTSTRAGPTAYVGQRVYYLKYPNLIQHANPGAAATYVPLDVTGLVNPTVHFMSSSAWDDGLRQLAQAQNVVWAHLIQPPYSTILENAFDIHNPMEVIDDTSFYRANCYDNIFVRGAPVPSSGMIDVMSELGSWPARPGGAVTNPQPAFVPNPWAAALGHLNPIAFAQLSQANATLQYTYRGTTYTITPQLADAEEAAVFYNEFISDHLPVFAEVQI